MAYAQTAMDTSTLLALRMLFSLPFFVAMAVWGGKVGERTGSGAITRRDWALLSVLGFLGYYLASFLDFLGLQYISAALERLILFTYPGIVLLFSVLFLGKTIHGREILALLLSFSGICIVFVHDLRITESPRALWVGSRLILLSSIAYSAYLVGNVAIIRRLGSMRFTGVAASISSVFVLGHFLVLHPLSQLRVPPSIYGVVILLALLSTAIPIWLTSEAIRRIGPSHVAIVGSVGPVITIGLSAWLLDEAVTVYTFLGTRAKRSPPAPWSSPVFLRNWWRGPCPLRFLGALLVLGGVVLVSGLRDA